MIEQSHRCHQAAAIFAVLKAANPAPKTELYYTNVYTLLVAVVLSAQATDKGVNKVTPALFAVANTPKAMLDLGIDTVMQYINTVNLYKNKAKYIMSLSKVLHEEHGGAVPCHRETLETLAGVGRKTANVVLNTAFGLPTMAVDTHIFRVSNRTGIGIGTTPLAVEVMLEKTIPDTYKRDAHHWLILHGRYVCKAIKPLCDTCSIQGHCDFYHANNTHAS
jgi:endonuclease III